ncbi:MAG: response regulator [Eubacteriales bacterium]
MGKDKGMYTLLIVDDEDNIRKALKHAVDWHELGFQILADVSNGIEAMDYIEKYDIDLLLTDIKMPIMGGIELARAAREIRPSMQIVFLSGHDEFDFAKQAIKYNILEYLLKPITEEQIIREFSNIKRKLDEKFSEILNIDEHQDTVKDLKNARRELFIAKLVNNGLTQLQIENFFKENEVERDLVRSTDKNYVLYLVKNDNSVQDEEYELRNRRLYNMTKIISEKYVECMSSIYGDYNIVIACGSQATLDKFMPILSKDIILSAKRVINMKTFFVQSDYYHNISDTYKAFQQTYEALAIAEKTDAQIIQTSDLKEPLEQNSKMTQSLETAMLSGKREEVDQVLVSIFRGMGEESVEFHTIILQMIGVLFKVSSMLESSQRDTILKNITFQIPNHELKKEITKLCIEITEKISSKREQSIDHISQKSIEIIKEEYMNADINLAYIAQKVHCSPNYLSSIIKKTTGESFIDILTKVRMEKANTLLRLTDKKIREISEECGYANQHYFSYSFKKYYDKSPNAVRKEIVQENI